MEVSICQFDPLRGSCWMKLPKAIRNKNAVLSIANMDQACFFWSIIAKLYPVDSPSVQAELTTSYPHYKNVLNTTGIELPVQLKSIPKFERLNNISVNVYTLENNRLVGPLYYTADKRPQHVNLLYMTNDRRSDGHYALITDIDRLISTQVSAHRTRKHLCDGCLLYFYSRTQYINHECRKCKVTLPEAGKNNIMKFTNYHKQIPAPFVIYADTEAYLKPIDPPREINEGESYTYDIAAHEPMSFAYLIKCWHDQSLDKLEVYTGPNCMTEFVKRLQRDIAEIANILSNPLPMVQLTPAERAAFAAASTCYVCDEPLHPSDACHDHDHLTGFNFICPSDRCGVLTSLLFSGRYRGAAHNSCNLRLKVSNTIPVILHNFSNYDAHFITTALNVDKQPIRVLAKTKEKYISIAKYVKCGRGKNQRTMKIQFVDSYRFLPGSLDNIAKTLTDAQLELTRKQYPDDTEFDLVKRKGVMPYEYFTGPDVLLESQLPPREKFYNRLTMAHVTDDEYRHAQNVWQTFGCQTLSQYAELYLKTDVFLLADVFQNFRHFCLKHYGLDPAHYLTSPSLSFDCMKKYTKVQLELMTDIEMTNFILKNIRGGLSVCNSHFSEANNKYMEDYDPGKSSKYLLQLDFNNLYGSSLSEKLPIDGFKFLSPAEIAAVDILNVSDDSDIGYILEIDIDFPVDKHSHFADLPFFADNIVPPLPDGTRRDRGSKSYKKLIASLYNKTKFVTHYRCLKQAVANGMILRKVHRVLQFRQSAWMQSFIQFNTELRANARTKFEIELIKFLTNSIFGKTLENPEKRINVRLVSDWANLNRKQGGSVLISKPTFDSVSIFNDNMVAIQLRRSEICYDRPCYVGFACLELAKVILYDFHYSFIKQKYGDRAVLLYSDTDSLYYSLETEDVYKDIRDNIDLFDTSNFPPDNIYRIPLVNKKQLYKIKDELGGTLFLKFIGIQSKSYYIKTADSAKHKKVLKGVQRAVVQNTISERDYLNCITLESVRTMRKMCVFRSRKHKLYTQIVNKIAMTYKDDKRFQIPNSYLTLPWGHHSIDTAIAADELMDFEAP